MTHINHSLPHSSPQLRVSVVIPCRNDAEFLQHSLDDPEKQTRQPNEVEVIVVDNDSTNQSVAVAKVHGVTLTDGSPASCT